MNVLDIKTKIANDFFNQDDYSYIYNTVQGEIDKSLRLGNGKYGSFTIHASGMNRLDFPFDKSFSKNLIDRVFLETGIRFERVTGFFARYTKESGSFPELFPHYDTAGNGYHTLTFTAQLNKSLDWPIYVNNYKADLDVNDCVLFSGTNDVHFRPSIKFGDEDYFDIFVCHFENDESQRVAIPADHFDKMQNLINQYSEKYRDILVASNTMQSTSDMLENFRPVIIKNIFSENEIEEIYNTRFNLAINEKQQNGNSYTFEDPSCGYITSVYPLPKHIRDKIVTVMQSKSFFMLKEDGNHIPRYTLESGSNPQLRPHYDVGLDYASMTLSVQLKNTIPWELCVGDDCFMLEENDAVLFSGSHQIHWRPDIEFSADDYYDIIVCQASAKENPLPLDDAHRAKMQKKADVFVNKYFN